MNYLKWSLTFHCVIILSLINTPLLGCPKGDKAYELLQYSKAIKEYEKCLKNNPNDTYLLEKMGDAYLILDNSQKAGEIYKKLAFQHKKYNPVILKYLNTLYLNNQLDTYQKNVDSLYIKYPKQKEIQKLKSAIILSQHEDFTANPVKFNAQEADYSPVLYGNKIVFSSSRPTHKKSDLFTGQAFSHLYVTDTISNDVIPFLPDFGLKFNMGSCDFTNSCKKIYFSANDKSHWGKNTHFLQIYESENINEQWSKPQLFVHNQRQNNNTHPAINKSENLFVFASDRYGNSGMDLYYCTRDAMGKWKQPTRLKNTINSNGNEVFPVFINDSLLIFSSDGLHTHGKGLDMYKTTYRKGKWSEPILLNEPFNSVADDYGLCSHDNMKTGYFTSNRNQAEGNEDIYCFAQNPLDSMMTTPSVSEPVITYISTHGILTTEKGEPIPDANIIYYNTDGDIIAEMKSNIDGSFVSKMPSSTMIQYKVEKKGYLPEMGSFMTQTGDLISENGLNLKLKPLKKDVVFTLENIYYDYDKWDILPESEVELNNLFDILTQYPNMKIELSSHTDARGKDAYNLSLSEKRAKSAVAYLLGRGIQKERIKAIGYGETKLTNHCVNGVTCSDEEHRKNRRTEVKIISLE